MKKNGKYRFSLQFGSKTENEINAGEFLERLGNKKSVIIVAALNEYLLSHPELQNPNCKIEIKFAPERSRVEIEEIVKTIVEQQLKVHQLENYSASSSEGNSADMLENDVIQMLDNLDIFQ